MLSRTHTVLECTRVETAKSFSSVPTDPEYGHQQGCELSQRAARNSGLPRLLLPVPEKRLADGYGNYPSLDTRTFSRTDTGRSNMIHYTKVEE